MTSEKKLKNKTKDQLVNMIVELEQEIAELTAEKENNLSVYGYDHLTPEAYEQVLRDKSI